ncbi:hypothetical protein [Desulforhopalus sp. IMCC35007]|uniref:hypothetical protein n=1 Tax=Desulforhopalus sp. IMCC35007 TaxID=2569543 RepID=UPI0010AEBDE7|nr:hypothetical protein [Desulforhopalus sp. IMCC35007]TKB09611.1 hypothetical protein FCL48_09175 [Desulforhopalus sp. IMCC35007]
MDGKRAILLWQKKDYSSEAPDNTEFFSRGCLCSENFYITDQDEQNNIYKRDILSKSVYLKRLYSFKIKSAQQ